MFGPIISSFTNVGVRHMGDGYLAIQTVILVSSVPLCVATATMTSNGDYSFPMETVTYLVIGAVALFVAIYLIWRFASQRQSLPCPSWLHWMVELDNPFTRVNRAATILEHLNVQASTTVADIGCGPGRLTIPLAKSVGPEGEVVAVDVQVGMIDRVRAKAQAEGLTNITFLQAGVGEGKLGRDCFDRAVLVTVLGEIPDREAAMREIYGAMKPAGLLSVTEVIFDPHFQGRQSVVRLAVAAGFREKAFFGNRIAYTIHFVKDA